MTNKRGTERNSPNLQNNTNNQGSVPNSVARRRTPIMGSSFSSSRRNSLRSTTSNTEQVPNSNGESEGSPRYPRRSTNQPQRAVTMSRYTRLGRRHTSTTNPLPVREPSDQTPGPRRSARISSRLSVRRISATTSPLTIPTPDPTPDPTPATTSLEDPTTPTGIQTPAPFGNRPFRTAYSRPSSVTSDSMEATPGDAPDTDIQSVEIVRVVPHRLIEIPSEEPFEPRPPPRYRPSSGRSIRAGVLRRARRLLRDSTSPSQPSPEPSTSQNYEPDETTPTQPRRQIREIRFSHTPTTTSTTATSSQQPPQPGSSIMSDETLRGRLFEHAEHEALNNMIMSTSVTANERLQRLRLLRLSRQQESDVTPRERLITTLLRRREEAGDSTTGEGPSSSILPTRLRMFEVPGQGAILMEDVRPEASLRMSLVQAQYLQEVLIRISSLLDNLHILSQMNERIEATSTEDPRLRTILAFATLDPDNMTYEQLLMLDELLPKNQGATKEMIANKTSLQTYNRTDRHENDSCIICITDFEESDGIRLLPCCHIYHFACVDNWLKRKKTCPMCRTPIDDKPSKMYLERLEKFSDFKK